MNLREYQSKQPFAQYAIPVPKGEVAGSREEAVVAAQKLGGSAWVMKAEVHAGGRGKACSVKVAKDLGPDCLPVHQVYLELVSRMPLRCGLGHRGIL